MARDSLGSLDRVLGLELIILVGSRWLHLTFVTAHPICTIALGLGGTRSPFTWENKSMLSKTGIRFPAKRGTYREISSCSLWMQAYHTKLDYAVTRREEPLMHEYVTVSGIEFANAKESDWRACVWTRG